MAQAKTISQLTLIKTFSCSSNCTVHTQISRKSFKFEPQVDESTTVKFLINLTIALLTEDYPSLDADRKDYVFQLYAARKSGRKVSDLPSFEAQQKILKTGETCFYLHIQRRQGQKKEISNTVSTRSIRTEMKPLEIKITQPQIKKERSCFCFS